MAKVKQHLLQGDKSESLAKTEEDTERNTVLLGSVKYCHSYEQSSHLVQRKVVLECALFVSQFGITKRFGVGTSLFLSGYEIFSGSNN